MSEKVVVAMSGGVDSSAAAYILKEQGYDVIGVTMQIWQKDEGIADDGGCCGLSAVEDARRVAAKLDIPHYVLNFRDIFREKVIDYFIGEYLNGRTPNPCIACNRYVKWEAFMQRALELGAERIATGHYARVCVHPVTGRYTLRKAKDAKKDQTYALYSLTQDQLRRTLLPVGDYGKDEIRAAAREIGLAVADKRDSQEICFVPDNDYGGFIDQSARETVPGIFIDERRNVIGRHKGIAHYTVGQRKGLGIALGKPMYVKKISAADHTVMLSDNESLYEKSLYAEDACYMSISGITEPIGAEAKIRYSHKPAACTVMADCNGGLRIEFDEPQRAITPGQAVVVYDGEYVLGGGVIGVSCV